MTDNEHDTPEAVSDPSHELAELSELARAKAELNSQKSRSEWLTRGIAILALFVSLATFYDARRNRAVSMKIEAGALLDEAMDILGGQEGTISIAPGVTPGEERNKTSLSLGAFRRSSSPPCWITRGHLSVPRW